MKCTLSEACALGREGEIVVVGAGGSPTQRSPERPRHGQRNEKSQWSSARAAARAARSSRRAAWTSGPAPVPRVREPCLHISRCWGRSPTARSHQPPRCPRPRKGVTPAVCPKAGTVPGLTRGQCRAANALCQLCAPADALVGAIFAVLHDEWSPRRCQPSGVASALGAGVGRWMVKVEPSPSWEATSTSPPWFMTAWRTMARPRPVPPVRRLRALSTR